MLQSIAAISAGASMGAVLRWFFSLALNGISPLIPFGTLAANLLGAYVIGLALGVFSAFSWLGPEWRLFVITGFLGGLTTFSSFSAEVVMLLQEQRMTAAMIVIALHLGGSLLLTFLGMLTFTALKSLFS